MPSVAKRGRGIQYDVELSTPDGPEVDGALIGENVSRNLALKGFCTVKTNAPAILLQDIYKELEDLTTAGRFTETPATIIDGLLGEEGSVRTAQLLPEDEGETTTEYKAIRRLNLMLDEIAGVMCDSRGAREFGFEIGTRTPGIIHESGVLLEDPPPMTEETCIKWMEPFVWQRFMMVLFLGPRGGMLELEPFEKDAGNALRVLTEAGMLIIFRSDLLRRKWGAPGCTGWALSAFLMQTKSTGNVLCEPPENPIALELEKWMEDRLVNVMKDEENEPELNLDTNWRYRLDHAYHQQKQTVAVRGMGLKYKSTWDTEAFFKSLNAGVDVVEEVGYQRWDHGDYYIDDPEAWKWYKVNVNHCCHIEGLELFDAKFFKVSPAESKGMDPMQRQILEIGYTALAKAGRTIKNLLSSLTGIYVACHQSEWPMVDQGPEETGGCEQRSAGTGIAGSIMSNRFSFIFGMNGPSVQFDTDASASLTVIEVGITHLDERKVNSTMSSCTGVKTVLTPLTWLHRIGLGLMSPFGRNFTFDSSGTGWCVAEGGGSLAISNLVETVDGERVVDSDKSYMGTIAACHIMHAGASANMTGAPPAHVLQTLMHETCRMAHLSPLSLDAIESHGEARQMVDAIEMSCHTRVYCHDSKNPVGMGSVKSNHGNGIQGGGMAAMIKVLYGQAFGWMAPTVHIRQLNPQIDDFETRSFINDEMVMYHTKSSLVSASSLGYGGTMGHIICSGGVDEQLQPMSGKPFPFEAIAFWPGGGGTTTHPTPQQDYHILGSWSSWEEPEPMEQEAPGTYAYTIVLGANRVEEFQILFDGDPNQVIHPPSPGAPSGSTVMGPSEESMGCTWKIDARVFLVSLRDGSNVTETELAMLPVGGGRPDSEALQDAKYFESTSGIGDRYRVKLTIQDKWRVVTWQWLDGPGHGAVSRALEDSEKRLAPLVRSPAVIGKYYIRGGFNCWTLEEMALTEEETGLYTFEVRIMRNSDVTFQIVRNKDQNQVFHPSVQGLTDVAGPGYVQPAGGLDWHMEEYSHGDVVRIEFQRHVAGSMDSRHVGWIKVGEEPLVTAELLEQRRERFTIVGSWDQWRHARNMEWNGKAWEYVIEVGKSGIERFQILCEGEWFKRFVPDLPDASPEDLHVITDEGAFFNNSWAVGKHESETGWAGKFVEVRLQPSPRGYKVKWDVLKEPPPPTPKTTPGRSSFQVAKAVTDDMADVPPTRSVVPIDPVFMTERDLIDE
jgi:polyketide synthase-associated protein